MSPSKRFKPIQKLASNKERKAATLFGATLKTRDAAQVRLQELENYLAEYQERFETASRKGIGAARLQEYLAFIGKLEVAIAEQRKVLAGTQADCDASKAEWRGQYTKSKAVDKAVENMQSKERKVADKHEQKLSDDRSQRRR